MNVILERIYVDFIISQRFDEYREVLEYAIDKKYHLTSMIDYYNNYYNKADNKKNIVLRHDIDDDLKGTKKFFEIEKELKVKSSYYFRLNTLDTEIANEVVDYGSEIGYHYEELATYCKKNKIKNKDSINNENITNIYEMFRNNIKSKFKNYDIKTISSHGDFYNREIGVPNHHIFNYFKYDDLGISIETYDKNLLNSFNSYISDDRYRPFWKNNVSIYDSINNNDKRILLLTHPGNWNCNKSENFKNNIRRLLRK
ncbi:hypothetical protein SAMN05216497_1435 [Clostridium cochlearium]|uniref:Polysaccharide deacetylase n=1 Tax=Clostridium cochlearium TaxID=1494 RepID=A0ABY0QPY9_CLOCO|nr:hypothetical protein [Clostridium cochlearium]SDL46347.1 hypothetical protein SAMN05216497_1435 [Clostridium cochlearium]